MRVLHSDLEKAQRKAGQHRHQDRHQPRSGERDQQAGPDSR